jgi:hypothetical protein
MQKWGKKNDNKFILLLFFQNILFFLLKKTA